MVKLPAATAQVIPVPKPMWIEYEVDIHTDGPFASSLPKTREEIRKMLEARAPLNPPADYVPFQQLEEETAAAVGADDEEFLPGYATFARNGDGGLLVEGRCIRGHLKDCALQVASFFPETKAFRAKFANKVYVVEKSIPLDRKDIDGTQQRFIQVMTKKGPRSSVKYIEYVNDAAFKFTLKVLNDGVIALNMLNTVFAYGSVHGIGQERSQGWGRYSYTIMCKP